MWPMRLLEWAAVPCEVVDVGERVGKLIEGTMFKMVVRKGVEEAQR